MVILLQNNTLVYVPPTNQTINQTVASLESFAFTNITQGIFKVVKYPLYATIIPTRGFYGSNIKIVPNKFGARTDSVVFRLDSYFESFFTINLTYSDIQVVELIPNSPFTNPADAFTLRVYEPGAQVGVITIRASYGCFEPCLKNITSLSELDGTQIVRTRLPPLKYDAFIASLNGTDFVSYVVLEDYGFNGYVALAFTFIILYFVMLSALTCSEEKRKQQ